MEGEWRMATEDCIACMIVHCNYQILFVKKEWYPATKSFDMEFIKCFQGLEI
jgi:hypothetical protein